MAFVNNNKKNARFNPNARDDRLMPGYVSSRRVHKEPAKKDSDIPAEELINTDPAFVLSMESDTRLDWFQMALMQAATGKLKAEAIYKVVMTAGFASTKPLKANVVANLHLFSPKQQKAIKESMSATAGDHDDRKGGDEKKKESKSGKKEKRSRSTLLYLVPCLNSLSYF
eukprot:TRINITY_DN38311_c0_g1_i1.p1 TRINITY_DN38311_c0_g1~~TRINITY_DN38311_c0_g1_i1.p1  ORF type:complete len:170 (+),score=44.65 TRINITY_DN38311_c0_g1_i1:151-660(+)